MHIFMTNDDGYTMPGLVNLARELSSFARITVIAPHGPRSSCSGSLTLRQPVYMKKEKSYGENITVFSCTGTTADCCKIGLEGYLREDTPDLIVSGVNNGFNLGSDCLYSGTVAGALESIFMHVPAMAISAETTKKEDRLDAICRFGRNVVETYFLQKGYQGILNVNIPDIPEEEIHWAHVKIAPLGIQRYDNTIREEKESKEQIGYWISGKALPEGAPDTDVFFAHEGAITMTPLTWNQTDMSGIQAVERIAKEKIDENR